MANDNEANFAKIGVFILAGVALIAGTLVYLGGAGGEKREYLVETYFSNDVSGLDVGSAVNFRGVRVGSVRRISFIGAEYDDIGNPHDRRQIYVELALDKRLFRFGGKEEHVNETLSRLVERGLHATVSSSGVTGLSKIELNFPKIPREDEKISWRPKYIVIPPSPAFLQSATDSVTQLLDQLNRMDFVAAWSNVVEVTGSANVFLQDVTTLIQAQKGNMGEIMDNVSEASIGLRAFTDEIRANPAALLRTSTPDRLDETR
jgi:ABC-type transporter Mla subunit MlaD